MQDWPKAPVPRDQLVLFATTLEARIPDDHPVRWMDEILAAYDWSRWEAADHGRRGQPPIPPRALAAEKIEKLLAELDGQLERALAHAALADAEDTLFDTDDSSTRLPGSRPQPLKNG